MASKENSTCTCEKTRRRWRAIRLLLFLVGLSLILYMPFKAATQSAALEGIYGPWFIQGAVVAVAGLLFAIRPGLASALPLWLRLGVGASALLWMRTGLACTPSLLASLQESLPKGGVASFHMTAQHVFLSAGVIGFALVPRFFAARMGSPETEPAKEALNPSPAGNTANH